MGSEKSARMRAGSAGAGSVLMAVEQAVAHEECELRWALAWFYKERLPV